MNKISAHHKKILTAIRRIKQEADSSHHITSSFNGISYTLVPITYRLLSDELIIKLLAKWRQENEYWFPAQFVITLPGTKKWLNDKVLEVDDRLLFLVQVDSQYIGHVGLFRFSPDVNEIELDNIVRGESGYPGLLGHSVSTMMSWGKKTLKIRTYTLQTASDNERALRFYKRLGFVEKKRVPLVRIKNENGWLWQEVPRGITGEIKRYNVFMSSTS